MARISVGKPDYEISSRHVQVGSVLGGSCVFTSGVQRSYSGVSGWARTPVLVDTDLPTGRSNPA